MKLDPRRVVKKLKRWLHGAPCNHTSQVYGFSLNVSKGTADSNVSYGQLRSDISSVQVKVSKTIKGMTNFFTELGQTAKD